MEIKVYEKVLPVEAKYIREKVFIEEQGFKDEFDDIDGISTHLVAFDNGKAVATCRFYKDDNIYYIGRLAVLKEYRGQSIATQLIIASEEKIKQTGSKIIRLHSQLQAQKFYEKLGFSAFGETDYDEYCLHIWMEKKL